MPDQDTTENTAPGGGNKMADITKHLADHRTGFVPPWPYRAPDNQHGAQ